MSAKPETTFIASVHKHLPPGGKPYRMKNNNPYVGGIFDCWYSGAKADLWIEYKFITIPKRDATMVTFDLSALQLEWGKNRLAEGRNVAVIVGAKEGGIILVDREWETPLSAADFRTALLDRKLLAEYIINQTQGNG